MDNRFLCLMLGSYLVFLPLRSASAQSLQTVRIETWSSPSTPNAEPVQGNSDDVGQPAGSAGFTAARSTPCPPGVMPFVFAAGVTQAQIQQIGSDGKITDVRISYPMDLTTQMLEFSGKRAAGRWPSCDTPSGPPSPWSSCWRRRSIGEPPPL